MNVYLDFVNIGLFFILVIITLELGRRNLNHLKGIFSQTESRNTLELRPIILCKYRNITYCNDEEQSIERKSIREYLKNYSPDYFIVFLKFDISNVGKMVAHDLSSKWEITKAKSESMLPMNVEIDISPTENHECTVKFKLFDIVNFKFNFMVSWKYGNKKYGKIMQQIEFTPTDFRSSIYKKQTFLDWKENTE